MSAIVACWCGTAVSKFQVGNFGFARSSRLEARSCSPRWAGWRHEFTRRDWNCVLLARARSSRLV